MKNYTDIKAYMTEFIKSHCIVVPEGKVEAKELYYKCWQLSGLSAEAFVGNRTLFAVVEELGYPKKRSSKNKVYFYGLTLKKEGE
ncbi:hypothetical protein AABM38_20595 [Heyndrickxia sp. MSNUG]|uniref:hypothetical protein n=1 Tax=Heyndrickxia sp. MSNUG TaxID=3136677 RepID=UPI003C3025A4